MTNTSAPVTVFDPADGDASPRVDVSYSARVPVGEIAGRNMVVLLNGTLDVDPNLALWFLSETAVEDAAPFGAFLAPVSSPVEILAWWAHVVTLTPEGVKSFRESPQPQEFFLPFTAETDTLPDTKLLPESFFPPFPEPTDSSPAILTNQKCRVVETSDKKPWHDFGPFEGHRLILVLAGTLHSDPATALWFICDGVGSLRRYGCFLAPLNTAMSDIAWWAHTVTTAVNVQEGKNLELY